MEKKEISIYWLLDKIISKKHTDSELNYIFQQAEAMHKKEMIDAILDNRNITSQVTLRDAEKYYNETFGETKNL
jgi:DNA polymerase II large subunit